jgi:fermentation-respiration switch protein FrsA (DUF1100 family)
VILGLDHLAIAVDDPDAAIAELAAFLRMPAGESGGRHAAWGTRNRLLWLGDTYVELVTVFDRRLAERSWLGRPTLRGLADGPTPICWALSTDDLDLDRAEMNSAGATLGAAFAGERRRPDGQIVRWRLALPPEVDLARPFLIEHDTAAAEWTPENRAERAAAPARVLALSLPVDGVEGMPTPAGGTRAGNQSVTIAGSKAGLTTIVIGGLDRVGVEGQLLGCRWQLA